MKKLIPSKEIPSEGLGADPTDALLGQKNVFCGSEFWKSEVASERSLSLAGRRAAARYWRLTSIKSWQEQNQDQIPTAPTRMIRSRPGRVMNQLGDLVPGTPQGLPVMGMHGAVPGLPVSLVLSIQLMRVFATPVVNSGHFPAPSKCRSSGCSPGRWEQTRRWW